MDFKFFMKQSSLFAKTKKEFSKDAETISHKYLVKGDFISQLMAGVYRFLPLGWRVYAKIEKIIGEEMDKIGGQRLFLSSLQPKSLWMETKRWETIDPPLFRLKDRHNKEMALASTHEEDITDLVRGRVATYKDLPIYLYQIQNKFRNETRASGGLLRVREFIMKDFYSFHVSAEDLEKYYEKVSKAYFNIFNRCGLKAVNVEAHSGTIGGNLSHEFVVFSETGENRVVLCPLCCWSANIEKAGGITNCPKCKHVLNIKTCVESGHAFNLGTKYSEAMAAYFIDKDGKKKPIVMGCYGIGLGRLMATIVEVNHDDKGIIWPKSVAPFQVHLLAIQSNKKIKETSEKIYADLIKKGVEVLYDDREDKSAGEKFADADLIGIPIRLVMSEKTLEKKSVEMKKRNEKQAKLVKVGGLLEIL